MESIISYKNRLIRGESFQLTQTSSWIPRYTLTLQGANNNWKGTPLHHDRLDKVFLTENEADEFALQDAMRWIDKR